MTTETKIRQIIDVGWTSYKNKVASGLFNPENEKMMQLQLAQTFQTLIPIFEYRQGETIKVLLEFPVLIKEKLIKRVIDIAILHSENEKKTYFSVEIKCFREFTRDGTGKKRGAQNLGMYDYWEDIENIEQYSILPNFSFGTQLTLTDDRYYMTGRHDGQQVSIYSTNNLRRDVNGMLQRSVANRLGRIDLLGNYSMIGWEIIGNFSFIRQENNIY